MDGFLQFTLLLIVTSSLILQVAVAFFSIRLMRLSRHHFSWIMLCAALVLMAFRQTIIFYHLLTTGVHNPSALFAELIALLTSLFLASGLFAIAPLMRRLYSKPDFSDGVSLGELYDRISSGVAVYEAIDKGRDFIIRDINLSAERIEKTARQYVVGRRLTEVFPGMETIGLPTILRRVLTSGQPERLPMRYYQDDRISGWRDFFVYRRSGGEVVAVYNDVSSQMHMQERLDCRDQKIRLLFDQSPVSYQSLDSAGRILEVNSAWLKLTGLERAEAIDRPFSELLSRSSRQRFQAGLAELKGGGTLFCEEIELRQQNGTYFPIELDARFLPGKTGGSGQIYCTLTTKEGGVAKEPDVDVEIDNLARTKAQEILAADRRELQRERFALLGELAAGMAHALSTPLAAARNAFSLMREGISSTSRDYEFSEMASHELARIADMIEQMYRFHETLPQERELVNINALLDNALILVRVMMKDRRIQFQDERSADAPLVILPPGAVMLTLIHPLRNSIEAMPPNGVLTVRTGPMESGGVYIEIEDDGPGIPREFLPSLLDPFTTFRQSSDGASGLGLGMAMVQRTLDLLGGSVSVRSDTGNGTCVRVVLPAALSERSNIV
jgi:PAS domain S-box-containing protein